MSDKVTRLGNGNTVVTGPRISRALYKGMIGDHPYSMGDDAQAVLIADADIFAAFNDDIADAEAKLERVNEELRKAGIEFPLGHRGVADLRAVAMGQGEEIDGILADAGLPYTAKGADGVRGLATAFEAAKAEVRRLDEVVKQLRTELHQVTTGGSLYDPEDTILQPVFNPEELP